MRLTNAVWRQHLGRMMKRHWRVQGDKKIRETTAEKDLAARGISVVDIKEVLKDVGKGHVKHEHVHIDSRPMEEPPFPYDSNHPLYKTCAAYMCKTNSVLVEGLKQVQILAKAVKMEQKFPQILESKINGIDCTNFDGIVQNCIRASHVFDAQQEKLPRLKDPARPAWNFPRVLGITDKRRAFLTCEKLVQLCTSQRQSDLPLFALNFGNCIVPIEKDGDKIQFQLIFHKALMSSEAMPKASTLEDEVKLNELLLPDIYPLKYTISMERSHFYNTVNVHPVNSTSKFHNLHTILIQHNETEIKNLHETPVEVNQSVGRCVLYGFAAAVSQARILYGEEVVDLPSPVVVQCIQTDGRLFDFCVFQLNTLNLNSNDGSKNMFWLSPREELFSTCCYKDGKPVLEGYNPQVFKYLFAFCNI